MPYNIIYIYIYVYIYIYLYLSTYLSINPTLCSECTEELVELEEGVTACPEKPDGYPFQEIRWADDGNCLEGFSGSIYRYMYVRSTFITDLFPPTPKVSLRCFLLVSFFLILCISSFFSPFSSVIFRLFSFFL